MIQRCSWPTAGEEGEKILVQHRLVDAQPLAHVPLQQHPIPGMGLLLPFAEVAQMLLVHPPEVLPISPEEAPHASGRHWVGIQPFFLRTPRASAAELDEATPRNNKSPLP